MADIARTQGELNALKEARKTHPDLTVEQLKETQTYRDEQAKFGTGSTIQRGIQAAAALQGLAGGDIVGALAGASAPELAHLLKSTEGNPAVNTIAHAILGGAVAALQGNSAAAGAAGAATGELAAKAIAGMLYPDVKDLSKLSEEQKQTVSALATISAGMAGGLAEDSTGSAVAGGQAGKNAAENNALGDRNKLPVNIFDINPLKPNVLDADGDPLKGGGGKGILPLGRGSTGRTTPNSLGEKLSMEQAMSNPTAGRQLPIPMTDPRWPRSEGWVKMAQNINGVEVHYVRNTKTGQVDDFKFK